MPISSELLIFPRHVQRHLQKRGQALFWKPTTDVYRCEDGWLLKLELAGVKPTDIELHTRHNFLCIKGNRADVALEAGFRVQSMEITYGEFERVFEFPMSLENAHLVTDFRNGMLLVRIMLGNH